MTTLTRESPAKINLTLRVTGVRADGFHEIESLVARISLCDSVSVSIRDDKRLTVECDNPVIPCDESNLAIRAARALAETVGVQRGVHISLTKRIPPGAGLGGGSSNAATTLRLLNDVWELGLTRAELARLGAQLGSDVPLFFHGPLCVIRGRGADVEDVDANLHAWAALALPNIHCSTPAVYAAWDQGADQAARPEVSEILAACGSVPEFMELLFNDLETPAFEVSPPLGELAGQITEAGWPAVRLTGSGAALFHLFEDESAATTFAAAVENKFGVRTAVIALQTS
ncbi:MAG: 4-(cytidine 5'-diphospho)-2-C-methyl-D-erythritol kinase [Phycisphaerae bacterium]|nr:4-(cytidine 5'-diphospho)-2-C-methyl-D-erythritol kinase [Phycisphaerae bacterium]